MVYRGAVGYHYAFTATQLNIDMSADQWTTLWRIFDEALEQTPDTRARWLLRHCEDAELRVRVLQLIEAAEQGTSVLDAPPLRTGHEALAPGATIGAWAVTDMIGRGGMGEVYRVERVDDRFQKQAALKLLSLALQDDQFRARFARERKILANLNHPGIARLIDAGSTDDGRPWFLMDLVQGQPITHCARDQQWTMAQRLQVFLQVCDAVAHAHRRLIVHRDLKPANILVNPKGQPVLLDFGIAGLLEQADGAELTRFDAPLPNTPQYASPEQLARTDTGTAVDVYSLGLLLYELACDQMPFRQHDHSGDTLQARKVALTPSQQGEDVPVELDWIVQKASAFEAEDRYPSVDALSADVQAVLQHRPPKARPAGRLYRLRKFVYRNRVAVAGFALAALVIAGLLGQVVYEGHQAQLARAESDRQRTQAEIAAEFMRELFVQSDATENDGVELTASELLERGHESLAARDDLAPSTRLMLLHTLSDVFANLGNYPRAFAIAEESLALAAAQGMDLQAVAESRLRMGQVHLLSGRSEPAQRELLQAESLLAQLPEQPVALFVDVQHALGRTEQALGRLADAGTRFERARAVLLEARPPDPVRVLDNSIRLGSWHWMSGRLEQAQALYSEAVQTQRAAERTDWSGLARALDAEASAHYALGDFGDAADDFSEAVLIRRRVLGNDHPLTARSLSHQGAALFELEVYQDAEQALTEAWDILQFQGLQASPQAAGVLNNLGLVLRALEQIDAADLAFSQALQINQAHFGAVHLNNANNLNNLGLIAEDRSDWLLAVQRYEEAEGIVTEIKGMAHADRGYALTNRARVLMVLARDQQAQALLEEALRVRAGLGEGHPMLAETHFWSGLNQCLRGERLRGRVEIERSMTMRGRVDHASAAFARERYAMRLCSPAGANETEAVPDVPVSLQLIYQRLAEPSEV